MKLAEIFNNKVNRTYWIEWDGQTFVVKQSKPKNRQMNRETLAQVYVACVEQAKRQKVTVEEANRFIRSLWIEETDSRRPKTFPRIIGEDNFLRLYALGAALSVDLFRRIWKRLGESLAEKTIKLNPINVGWNQEALQFNDVDASPPGFFPKLLSRARLKKDHELIEQIENDLALIANIEERDKRVDLTLAVLSHGAAYRELEGRTLKIPSFDKSGPLIPYICTQYLLAEGVKTISLIPVQGEGRGIYLCQGTELWPSQPSMLGSLLANFAAHGSATEAYAHSWRRIHKHLRDLKKQGGVKPFVAGHSMGGAMAIQIGLYSHDLIEKAYAFNPPMPNERDYAFYHTMHPTSQEKIKVIANLDDLAFWRMGAKVIGQVTIFLCNRRWQYYPVSILDSLLIIPACAKFVLNVRRAFPAHQKIYSLSENFLSVVLTQEEIERENKERASRFDYLHFFPKIYDPMRKCILLARKTFGWRLTEQYLRNEIEIIALHERDLVDTLTDENRGEIERELQSLHLQKQKLQEQLPHS